MIFSFFSVRIILIFMTDKTFKKIVKEAQTEIRNLARKNDFEWFYKLHQLEVIKYAHELLKVYKQADKKIVLIACWLHDIAHYSVKGEAEILRIKKEHHLQGAKIAGEFLKKFRLSQTEVKQIKNCVLRHRNSKGCTPQTLEEKVVAVADSLSHFGSVFYFTYFKIHPQHSLELMVNKDLKKMERDWRDLNLLPKSRKLVETEYKVFKKLFEDYKNSRC